MRKAFSMITAIFVILLMATVSMLILNISAKTVKNTVTQYKYEQAVLYAKSYTELAIMYATSNNAASVGCAENINGVIGNADNGEGYDIQTRIYYIGNGLACSGTRILNPLTAITTPNELQIIVDVYVRYRDPDVIAAWGTTTNVPWLTYHRRTLQKL